MSKKRTSSESNNDGQATEGSDSVFQQADNTKRARLDPSSDTMLEDLPIELLECILVKAIAMEVKGLKLAKSVWKEKADLVISRLRTVCPQWSSVLTTDFFRNELHRALDGIAQETIRLEVLHKSDVYGCAFKVTTMKDDIFMLCAQFDEDTGDISFNIRYYERNNIIAEVACYAIELEGICRPGDIAACNVSNCLYVVDGDEELHCSSILRFTRGEEHQFNIDTWISDLRCEISYITVSVHGNLIIISTPEGVDSRAVTIYCPNGFLQHEVMLSPDIHGFRYVKSVIQKSNGNLILETVGEESQIVLTEIDMDGIIERQYKSSLSGNSGVNFADTCGRILIYDPKIGMELLDPEFNLLGFEGPQPEKEDFTITQCLHYISESNEVVGVCDVGGNTSVLTIFRFSEE